MSDFFDSDIVREELQEINELQMSIYKNAMKFGTFSREDKVDPVSYTHLTLPTTNSV